MKIAVIGKMRSGKNTFADFFINRGLQEFKFGTGIAEIIQKYFPEEWEKGKPRHLYQGIGQYLRSFNQDVWVKYLAKQIEGKPNVIVTDCRQANEVKWLKENGFYIVKVEADEEVRIQRIKAEGDTFKKEDLYHETELQVDMAEYDMLVSNNGSIEDLHREALDLYSALSLIEVMGKGLKV